MQSINEELFNIIRHEGTKLTLPKGHIFYDGYDRLNAVYCLEKGLCALMSLKESGKEHVYHYMKEGSLIGFSPALLEHIHEDDTDSEVYFLVKAKSPCTVYRIDKERIFVLMQEHPELMKWIMGNMANTCRSVLRHFYTAQESNAVSKIAITLLSLAEEINGDFVLNKEFNYPEISRYLGVHHITVARIVGALKREGIIEKTGHSIKILDQDAMMEYVQNKKALEY